MDLLKKLQKSIRELNIELAAPQQEIKLDHPFVDTIASQIQLEKPLGDTSGETRGNQGKP